MSPQTSHPALPRVAILVLNYHQPEATLACIRSLQAREGRDSLIVWLENDAAASGEQAEHLLTQSGLSWLRVDLQTTCPPPAGTIAYLPNPENLGYAGGNNVGLRWAHGLGIPFAWVLNNDTLLEAGSSADLVSAAEADPGVGLWGTGLRQGSEHHWGGRIDPETLYCEPLLDAKALGQPFSYVSGCSLFLRVEEAQAMGWLPEHYFLYYEDPTFSTLALRQGRRLAAVESVLVHHVESLSTGRRSALMEYYNKRNRWFFMQAFYPELLETNRRRLTYTLQKYLFRFRFRRAWLEWLAYRDFQKGRTGRSTRNLRGST